jgi:hypothetical protein
MDMAATALRIIKNPLQFAANKQFQTESEPHQWTGLFASTCTLYNIRVYTLIDFLVYFIWIFGTFGTSQSSMLDTSTCGGILVDVIQYEILLSSLSYVTCIILYATTFLIHRASLGRCLPGYVFDNR